MQPRVVDHHVQSTQALPLLAGQDGEALQLTHIQREGRCLHLLSQITGISSSFAAVRATSTNSSLASALPSPGRCPTKPRDDRNLAF
ncbi:MAG: hypothetical protein RMJ98_04400 [Myxococcales bacterium]|nr:hypothetical protein [Polyangiaceae bacterium]MDW8248532.1 hypothetical protein [Myxococcales bacterium]